MHFDEQCIACFFFTDHSHTFVIQPAVVLVQTFFALNFTFDQCKSPLFRGLLLFYTTRCIVLLFKMLYSK